MDRATERPVIMASTAGGMDIEEVAHDTPEKILREGVHPLNGFQPYQGRKLAGFLGLTGAQAAAAGKLFTNL